MASSTLSPVTYVYKVSASSTLSPVTYVYPVSASSTLSPVRYVYEVSASSTLSPVTYVYEVSASSTLSPVNYVYYVGCFPKSELVHTDIDSLTSIGSIRVGSKICSWNIDRQKTMYTAVTEIHEYKVKEIMLFNGIISVSSCHPFMVMECTEHGISTLKWKVASDVNLGDDLLGANGKLIKIKSKNIRWYDDGIEVLNLSTDCGVPFMVGNCVVRAGNAQDNIAWADTPVTQRLIVAA